VNSKERLKKNNLFKEFETLKNDQDILRKKILEGNNMMEKTMENLNEKKEDLEKKMQERKEIGEKKFRSG